MARSITFTIPGTTAGDPSVVVTATEQLDGSLLFELTVVGGTVADLRGLFFDVNDPALADNLQGTGADVLDQLPGDDDNGNFGDDDGPRVGFDIGTGLRRSVILERCWYRVTPPSFVCY